MISVSSTAQRPLLSRQDSDFLRVTASVMVVVVHCIHVWVERFNSSREFLSLGFLGTVIDQCVRFTVPVFFFLSGYGLASQFRKEIPPLSVYYRTRLPKIAVPFLFWSLFASLRHLDYFMELPWTTSPWLCLWHFIKFFLFDGFDYQFYFMIILFQFYLIFPFIYRWAQHRWALVAVLAIQLIFMTPTDALLGLLGWQLPPVSSSLVILYGFYCCAGIYLASHPDSLGDMLRKFSSTTFFFLWLGSLGLMILEFWINIRNGKSLSDCDHFNRWTVILYCLTSLMLFLKNKEWVRIHIHKNLHWQFLYTGMAPYTFFVYLFHTHVLRFVDLLFWEVNLWDFITRILWVVTVSYAIAWFAQWLLQDFPRIRFALSLPQSSLKPADLPGYSFLTLYRNRRDKAAITSE